MLLVSNNFALMIKLLDLADYGSDPTEEVLDHPGAKSASPRSGSICI